MTVFVGRPSHRRRVLRGAKRKMTKLFRPPDCSAELTKSLEIDPDDLSTMAPASPTPSTSDASSSNLPQDELDAHVGTHVISAPKDQLTTARRALRKREKQVLLLPSVFEGRQPVLFFCYTDACGAKQRYMGRAMDAGDDVPGMFFVHGKKGAEYNAVINSMRQGGLKRGDEHTQNWSLLWSKHPSPDTMCTISATQKTNHFPGSWHLGDKGLLWKCITTMQKRFQDDFSIMPGGYILPEEGTSFEAARRQQPSALWIWKPMNGSCGKGIKVLGSQHDCASKEPAIVQRYVPSPLTINGYKFDLRLYVVVVSYEPLKVYLNTEGLVRLATQKYSEDPSTLSDRMRHLTNYSINKKSASFVKNNDTQHEGAQSSKWSLSELRSHFEATGLDYDAMFESIKDVVVKTLLAVEPQLRAEWEKALGGSGTGWLTCGPGGAHAASCFELYGFDVLVDTNLKPWLLEVNLFPNMSSGSPLDKRIKTKLIADTLTLSGLKAPPASVSNRSELPALDAEMTLSSAELVQKAARLASCETPLDAIRLYDEAAWHLVMEAHDQDMRRGGLERIYPTSASGKYVPFMAEESYYNVVLRKFYEAGGAEQFWGRDAKWAAELPCYVPRQTCFHAS